MSISPTLSRELRDLVRSYKLLFVPLVFVFLGVSQPIIIKLLPTLMKSASNLPQGAIIQIPTPPPAAVIAGAFGSFNQLGLITLILVVMGAVAGERLSGVAATVLSKPVGRRSYLLAKMASYGLLTAFSLLLGLAAAAYYTGLLIGPVEWAAVANGYGLFLPYLLLVVALTLSCSTLLPSPVAAGGTSVLLLVALNLIPKYLGESIASISPGALTESAVQAVMGEPHLVGRPMLGVLTLMILALLGGWIALERQDI
jgi:ABC-2 type transport system permease protein